MSDRLFNLSHVNHARAGHTVVVGEARYAPGGVCGPISRAPGITSALARSA